MGWKWGNHYNFTLMWLTFLTFWRIFPFCFSLYSVTLIFLHNWHHTICSWCTSAKAPFWAAEAHFWQLLCFPWFLFYKEWEPPATLCCFQQNPRDVKIAETETGFAVMQSWCQIVLHLIQVRRMLLGSPGLFPHLQNRDSSIFSWILRGEDKTMNVIPCRSSINISFLFPSENSIVAFE